MARVDLTEANGFIPEEYGSQVIQAITRNSATEAFARRESMSTRTKSVPRFVADAPEVVAEGATIPEATATLDEVVLTARKYAKIFNVSEEDVNDSLVDVLNTYKVEWASRWARKYDNATLAVTSAADGTDVAPFTSVYKSVLGSTASATNYIATGGALNYDDINNALAAVESGDYFDAANTVFMAHPKMLGHIRGMVHGTSNELVLPDPLGTTPGSLFGYPLVVSYGAATSASATANPTGNPLLICGNRNMLINGVRGTVESAVSRDADFAKDGVLLKVRVRRGFAVADANAFAIVEKTS